MRHNLFSKTLPAWACAAVLTVAAPGVPAVWAASHQANAQLLSAQLPNGGTLRSAPIKDVANAVRAAVSKRPGDAADIVRIAIQAKTPKNQAVDCPTVRVIVNAAVMGAPSQAREISELAQSMVPDCGQEITDAVGQATAASAANGTSGAVVPGATSGQSADGTTAAAGTTVSGGDFSAGFGPGFPGSPGFGGSSPSGGFALPPATGNQVTPVVNG